MLRNWVKSRQATLFPCTCQVDVSNPGTPFYVRVPFFTVPACLATMCAFTTEYLVRPDIYIRWYIIRSTWHVFQCVQSDAAAATVRYRLPDGKIRGRLIEYAYRALLLPPLLFSSACAERQKLLLVHRIRFQCVLSLQSNTVYFESTPCRYCRIYGFHLPRTSSIIKGMRGAKAGVSPPRRSLPYRQYI